MKTLLLLTTALIFAGCLSPSPSPKPQYYMLQPAETFPVSEQSFDYPFLIIGPIDLSPYLDQPKFALQVSKHEIQYQEYHRWAEALEVNVASVVAENLRHYFQTTQIGPGAPKLLLRREQPRILVLINRMDVDLAGKAHLSVQWALNVKDKTDQPTVHLKSYQAQVQGDDMPARISALNQLVTAFSLDVARSIESEK